MRRLLTTALVVVSLLLGGCGGGKQTTTTRTTTTTPTPGSTPSFALAPSQAKRIQEAGLTQLTAEGSVVHYHVHLDVFYDGQPVVVPADIGIDYDAQRISPVHSHHPTGVIHVEANKDDRFTLGQFLIEWGLEVKGNCVAGKCGDQAVAYVNGAAQDGSAASVALERGQEIALVLGAKPADIPSTYDCAAHPEDGCPTA